MTSEVGASGVCRAGRGACYPHQHPIKRHFPHNSSQRHPVPIGPRRPRPASKTVRNHGRGRRGPLRPSGKVLAHGEGRGSWRPTEAARMDCAARPSHVHMQRTASLCPPSTKPGSRGKISSCDHHQHQAPRSPADGARVQLWGPLPGRRECPSEMQRQTPPACLGAWIQLFLKMAQLPKLRSCPHAHTNLRSIRTPATKECVPTACASAPLGAGPPHCSMASSPPSSPEGVLYAWDLLRGKTHFFNKGG